MEGQQTIAKRKEDKYDRQLRYETDAAVIEIHPCTNSLIYLLILSEKWHRSN
jgi:hypothetical protein